MSPKPSPSTTRRLVATILIISMAAATLPGAAASQDDGASEPVKLIVGFHRMPATLSEGGTLENATVLRTNPALDYAMVETRAPDQYRQQVQQRDDVSYVQDVIHQKAIDSRDDGRRDPYLPPQTGGLDHAIDDPEMSNQYGVQQINADDAWEITTGETTKTVCITDTGLHQSHEDLPDARYGGGIDTVNGDSDPDDDHGHGTHTTGTAAAGLNNGVGIAGSGNVEYLHAKIFDSNGFGDTTWIADGIQWCNDNGADVISMSWHWPQDTTVENALDNAYNNGILLVAAAGNDGSCTDCVNWPATKPEVVAVSCTDSSESQCSFSSQGSEVELAAPGQSVRSTADPAESTGCGGDGNLYSDCSGTSMSTPHVAGAATLIWSFVPTASRDRIRSAMTDTAQDLGTSGHDNIYGHGEVDVRAALDSLLTYELDEGFEGGAPVAWGFSGLWHVTSNRAHDGTESAWYGQESTGDYDTGSANSGVLQTPSVTIPDASPRLTYKSWYETESGTTYDQKLVQVSTDGSTWTTLQQVTDTQQQWNTEVVDLSDYAGQSVQIRWKFDTVDGVANSMEGWYVDDAAITGLQDSGGGGGTGLSEDFEDGASDWSFDGLWHTTDNRASSPTQSAWYGQESTGDYDTGSANSGSLTSPTFTVPQSDNTLTFQAWYDTESGTTYDQKTVEISTDGGSSWTELHQLSGTQQSWHSVDVDLSSYAGQSVQIRFHFDTIDSVANSGEGWYVDDVNVGSGSGGSGFADDFEGDNSDWGFNGLWHVTQNRANSPTHSIWYGQESTGDYDTGSSNMGHATSPEFTVPSDSPTLTFAAWYHTEAVTTYDQKTVHISTDGGSSWTELHQLSGTQQSWHTVSVDLTGYEGETAQVRFTFDTIDSVLNDKEGWYVDDVEVSSGDGGTNTAPSACFSVSPSEGTTSTLFDFDASCSSDSESPTSDLEVRWDWTDDGFWDTGWSTDKTEIHSYSSSGTKTIRVQVRDPQGLTDQATDSVLVNNPPNACFTDFPDEVQTGETVFVDATCSSDDLTPTSDLEARWDWTDDGFWDTGWSTDLTKSHSYGSSGTKTIRVQVRDEHGSTDTDTDSVLVNNPPNACFDASPDDGDLTTTFQFDASCSSDDLTSLDYRWDFENDGSWDTGWRSSDTASHQYDSLGDKTVKLQVRDGHGLKDATTRTVTVHVACVAGTCVG